MNPKTALIDKEITQWSGMIFMKKMFGKMGVQSKLIFCDLT